MNVASDMCRVQIFHQLTLPTGSPAQPTRLPICHRCWIAAMASSRAVASSRRHASLRAARSRSRRSMAVEALLVLHQPLHHPAAASAGGCGAAAPRPTSPTR
uniref:Uncharacterized protein n=1 Tax=Setaria italica TaxID=4555 RepID=K3Z1C0_SETIT